MPPINKIRLPYHFGKIVSGDSASCISEESADIRLFNSPTLRFEKKFMGRVISLK